MENALKENGIMTNRIEFGDIKISDVSKRHINDCMATNRFTQGQKVKQFEQQWQKLFNYPYTTMFNSGTSANMAACIALHSYKDTTSNSEIICPALSFIASATAIRAGNFIPKFVDIGYDLQIDIDQVANAINPNTVAVMGVNLMGKPCDMKRLSGLCHDNDLTFIIDNCEAYGCKVDNGYSLTYADMETTSHYLAHIITCVESGTVSSYKEYLRDILESIRSHGRPKDSLYFDHPNYGLNLKSTDLHASIGLGEIEKFWDIFNKRRENLKLMNESVDGMTDIAWFIEEDKNCVNAPHAFSITLKPPYANKISFLRGCLNKAGISWKRNFGSIPHHQAFKYLNYNKWSMPRARYMGNYGIHIGCHQYLTTEELHIICTTLKTTLRKIKYG